MGRKLRIALLYAALAGGTVSCAGTGPLKVVFAGSFSGPASAVNIGLACRNGAILAAEEINAAGGVGGRKLELVLLDDRNEAAGAAARDEAALAAAGSELFIGHLTSAFSAALLELAAAGKALIITPTMGAPELKRPGDLILRLLVLGPETQGDVIGALAAGARVRNAAVLVTEANLAFMTIVADRFDSAFGGRAGRETLPARPDYAGVARRIAAGGKDCVVVLSGAADVVGVATQLRKLGWEGALFGVAQGMTAQTLEQGGRAVEGMRFVGFPQNDATAPRFRAFSARYEARFGEEPSFTSPVAYEAVLLAAAALRAGGGPAAMRDALLAGPHPGVTRELRFDANGDVAEEPVAFEVRGGAFVAIK